MVRAAISVRKFGRGGRAFAPHFRSATRPRHRGLRPDRPLLCGESSARRSGNPGRRAGLSAANRGRPPRFATETSIDHRDFQPQTAVGRPKLRSIDMSHATISKVHRLHTPSSATCPGAAPVADLANLGPRLCFAGPQRRSTAATDWPGVRPISPARRPIPMPIPTRDPVPLVRRADHAWLAPTSCIGHNATFRRMSREPARATNAGGPAARDECVGHERERGRSA